ncbi:MAG TPA: DUF4360 domain-containing protein, partial [Bauldia sp.]|nr:DUF4360 domain-containing protein [Bauldia sp.]
MKRRLAFPLLLALLAAGEAAAANGCPPGSVSITKSPDGTATSVLFDTFSVDAGGGTGTTRATCSLSVPVALTPGRVGVYRADYRGFAVVGAGQAASLTITAPGRTTNLAITGP